MNDVSLMGVKLRSVPLCGDENRKGGAQRRQGRLLQRCESIRRANASTGVSREDESPPTLIPSWGEKLLWRAGVQISTAGFLMQNSTAKLTSAVQRCHFLEWKSPFL